MSDSSYLFYLGSHLLYILPILCLVIAVLFKLRSPLQYYAKIVVFSAVVTVVSIFIIPFYIFRPNRPTNVE
jgi:hypothetical protein